MVDKGEKAALSILLDIKDFTMEKKINYLMFLLKYCHSSNYKFFFLINYKHAKLLFKSVVRKDTTTLVQANEASLLLESSKAALARAIYSADRAAVKY